jgi:hypothetical protein
MKRISFAILLVFSLATQALAGDIYFNKHPVLWENPDILIWTPDGKSPIDPKELCLSLKRTNTGIGEPKCRIFGE